MSKIQEFVNFLTILVLSTALHELAHAWTAVKFGDQTPREHGRLTFNPLAHLDPFWSLLLPSLLWWTTGGYMVGAWTPVNPMRMRKPRLHGALTALAGPAMNAMLVLLSLGIVVALAAAQGGVAFDDRWQRLALLAVVMNISFAVFNMIPLPPLDGSHLLEAVAPPALRPALAFLHRHSMILFGVLLVTGLLGRITTPIMEIAGGGIGAVLGIVDEVIRGG
jgi:Zn-dependent protease